MSVLRLLSKIGSEHFKHAFAPITSLGWSRDGTQWWSTHKDGYFARWNYPSGVLAEAEVHHNLQGNGPHLRIDALDGIAYAGPLWVQILTKRTVLHFSSRGTNRASKTLVASADGQWIALGLEQQHPHDPREAHTLLWNTSQQDDPLPFDDWFPGCFFPQRPLLVLLGKDSGLCVIAPRERRTLRTWKTNEELISSCVSPDETIIYAATPKRHKKALLAFDLATGKERWRSHSNEIVRGMCASKDGREVLAWTRDGMERFDAENGTPLRRSSWKKLGMEAPGDGAGMHSFVALSNMHKSLLVGYVDRFEVRSAESTASLTEGHLGRVCALSVGPDGKRVASIGSDGMLRVWNLTTTESEALFEIGTVQKHTNVGICWSRDGRELIAFRSYELLFFDVASATRTEYTTLQRLSSDVLDSGWLFETVSLSPDGDTLLFGLCRWSKGFGTSPRCSMLYHRPTKTVRIGRENSDIVSRSQWTPSGIPCVVVKSEAGTKVLHAIEQTLLYSFPPLAKTTIPEAALCFSTPDKKPMLLLLGEYKLVRVGAKDAGNSGRIAAFSPLVLHPTKPLALCNDAGSTGTQQAVLWDLQTMSVLHQIDLRQNFDELTCAEFVLDRDEFVLGTARGVLHHYAF